MESRPKKLLDQVGDAIRVKHYARNTEQAYVYWIKKYILLHNKRHPKEMGTGEVQAVLHEMSGIHLLMAQPRTKGGAQPIGLTDASVGESKKLFLGSAFLIVMAHWLVPYSLQIDSRWARHNQKVDPHLLGRLPRFGYRIACERNGWAYKPS
jgi:hypothetical protein